MRSEEELFVLDMVALVVLTLYYFSGIVIFYFCRNRASLKARLPCLTLIAAGGILLKDVVLLVFKLLELE